MLIPLSGPIPGNDRVTMRELEKAEVASTVHRGEYTNISEAYNALMRWIEENGYSIAGKFREVYLKEPEPDSSPEDYLTEIQVPIAR